MDKNINRAPRAKKLPIAKNIILFFTPTLSRNLNINKGSFNRGGYYFTII